MESVLGIHFITSNFFAWYINTASYSVIFQYWTDSDIIFIASTYFHCSLSSLCNKDHRYTDIHICFHSPQSHKFHGHCKQLQCIYLPLKTKQTFLERFPYLLLAYQRLKCTKMYLKILFSFSTHIPSLEARHNMTYHIERAVKLQSSFDPSISFAIPLVFGNRMSTIQNKIEDYIMFTPSFNIAPYQKRLVI